MVGEGARTAVKTDPLRKALTHSLLFWSVAAPTWLLARSAVGGSFARDFRHAFLPAAQAIVRGTSPYPVVNGHELAHGTAFLYPPVSAFLLTPFTVLPPLLASVLATALVVGAVPATLLFLGVRDWRCHAVGFLWVPTLVGIQTANLTLPMLVGLALAWRYRDRVVASALAIGGVVALKLFFWPLLVWLIATRRYRTAALATLMSAALVLLPWAAIGFAGLRGYPHLLTRVSHLEGVHSYSLAALLHPVLPSWTAATLVATVVGGALVIYVLRAGLLGHDRDAFALAIVAVLVLSPLVEMHYFAVLLVIVALYRKRLALAWLAPLLIWGASAANSATPLQIIHVLAVAAATVALAMSDRRPRIVAWVLRLQAA